MPILIDAPTRVAAAGEPPKRIDEYIGRVRSRTESGPAGAEYVAVCVPAFALDAAHRDE